MSVRHRAKQARALLALLAAWFGRAPILETAGKAWVVHAIPPADVIVVLDAGLETQPFAAAALYKNGWAVWYPRCRRRSAPALRHRRPPSRFNADRLAHSRIHNDL